MTISSSEGVEGNGKPTPELAKNTTYIPYNAGVDGLRAIAVLAVIGYHSEFSRISGGFLGVEIFFVISGYLITALLLGEYATNTRIDLKRFWSRRARRLFPALVAYVVGATVLANMTARDVVPTKSEILSAFGYVYNWFSIFQDVSYTEGFERKNFFHHLWSLAVEEQFYLFWPLLLWGLLTVAGKKISFFIIVVGIAASTMARWVLYEPFSDPLRVYYGTDTRASALLIGAALAFIWRPWESQKVNIKNPNRSLHLSIFVLGSASVAGLIWANMHYTLMYPGVDRLFQGGMLITSLLTALVIAVVVIPESIVGKVLGIAPLRWIGKRSYGLYLWHWPVFQLTRPRVDVDLDGTELFLVRMAITLILVEISYQFIERPIRERRLQNTIRAAFSLAGLQATFIKTVGVGVALIACFITLEEVQADWSEGSRTAEEVAQEKPDEVAQEKPDEVEIAPTPSPTPIPTPILTPTPVEQKEETFAPTPNVEPPIDSFDLLAFVELISQENSILEDLLHIVLAPEFPIYYSRVTFLGDSVMKGALTNASIEGLDDIFDERISTLSENVNVEAEVNRQWFEARGIISTLNNQGKLGEAIVIHLGNNGVVDEGMIERAFEVLTDAEIVVIINTRVPRRWQERVNNLLQEALALHDKTVFVDWLAFSDDHPEFFSRDGVHLSKLGAEAYLDQIILGLGGKVEINEESNEDVPIVDPDD